MTRIKRLKASDMFAAVYKGGGDVKQFCRIMLHKSMAAAIGINGHKALACIEFDQATGRGWVMAAGAGRHNCRATKASRSYRDHWAFNVPYPSGTPMPQRRGRASLPAGRGDRAEFVLDGMANHKAQPSTGQLPLEQREQNNGDKPWIAYCMVGNSDNPMIRMKEYCSSRAHAEEVAQEMAASHPPGTIAKVARLYTEVESETKLVTRKIA